MNTSLESTSTTSQRLRRVIQRARKDLGCTQEDIDRAYVRLMAEAGQEAPKSIMTKVRDKRRDFSFSLVEAQCLARALKIPPSAILEVQDDLVSQASVDKKTSSAPAPQNEPVEEQTGMQEQLAHYSTKPDPKPEVHLPSVDPRAEPAPKSSTSEAPKEAARGVFVIDRPEGLMLSINMSLSARQFDRLKLAVPSYMMKTSPDGDKTYVKTKISIFPYQAELIMRAIFGGESR